MLNIFNVARGSTRQQTTNLWQRECCSSYHATNEVGLDFFWVNIPDIQNVQLSFGTI